MINPLIIWYCFSSYSFLERVAVTVRTSYEMSWYKSWGRKDEGVERAGKSRATEKNIPKLKRKQWKKETPCGYKTDISISLCSFLIYCTFLQKPEKRTWLYSSLFLSSLEMRVKPELVSGQSRTCGNQRTVLLPGVGWCHRPLCKPYRNVSGR